MKKRVLFLTNLFPNRLEPVRSVFNLKRALALAEHVDVEVLAPIPWFPLLTKLTNMPARETIEGLTVHHPRAFYTPKVGRRFYGTFFYRSARKYVLNLYARQPFDLIYAVWTYPDGYAAVRLAQDLNCPCLVHAMGSDINLHMNYSAMRERILWTLHKADAVVSVSRRLKSAIVDPGVPADKVHVVYNGVDSDSFQDLDRQTCRRELTPPTGTGKLILFVGNLVAVKAVDVLLNAMARLRNLDEGAQLVLIGDGRLRTQLEAQTRDLKLDDCARFLGRRPHEEVARWLGACDLLCLPSHNEGVPNVILEALASGRPVVATRVGGIPEIIDNPDLGILVEPGDAEALASALNTALAKDWDPARLTAVASRFTWGAFGRNIAEIIRQTLDPGGD